MTESVEVNRGVADLHYLDDDFQPAHKLDAVMVELVFEDNGETSIGTYGFRFPPNQHKEQVNEHESIPHGPRGRDRRPTIG